MKEGGGRKGEAVLGDRGPTEDSITDGVLVLFPDALARVKQNLKIILSICCQQLVRL